MGPLGTVQNRPVTQTTTQPTQQPATPPAAETPAPAAAPQLSPGSAANLANLRGASSSDIQRRAVAMGPISNPARSAAVEQVNAVSAAYDTARTDVNRLNAHLDYTLRNEPAVQGTEAQERFRADFMNTHAAAYERERTSARQLADTLRAAEPHLRADGDLSQRMDMPAQRDRMDVSRAIGQLASSSEFGQAAQLAGQFSQGTPPVLPQQVAQEHGNRAAATSVQRDLAHGHSPLDAVTNAGALLGGAGLLSRTPALTALSNALSTRDNVREYVRTGDPASIGAAGFGALGAGTALYAMAAGGGLATAALGGAAFLGKTVLQGQAANRDYQRAVEPSLQRAFGMGISDLRRVETETRQQAFEAFARTSPESQRLFQAGGQPWLDHAARNIDQLESIQRQLIADRMAAARP